MVTRGHVGAGIALLYLDIDNYEGTLACRKKPLFVGLSSRHRRIQQCALASYANPTQSMNSFATKRSGCATDWPYLPDHFIADIGDITNNNGLSMVHFDANP